PGRRHPHLEGLPVDGSEGECGRQRRAGLAHLVAPARGNVHLEEAAFGKRVFLLRERRMSEAQQECAEEGEPEGGDHWSSSFCRAAAPHPRPVSPRKRRVCFTPCRPLALNLFNVSDRVEYMAYSRRSAREVQARGGRVVALGKFRESAAGEIKPRSVLILVE